MIIRENIIKLKSFDFALRIVKLYKYLVEEKKEFELCKQLLRSGTSIGAMIKESEHAESKADFIHKISVALKKLMKQNTGLNNFINQILLMKKFSVC